MSYPFYSTRIRKAGTNHVLGATREEHCEIDKSRWRFEVVDSRLRSWRKHIIVYSCEEAKAKVVPYLATFEPEERRLREEDFLQVVQRIWGDQ